MVVGPFDISPNYLLQDIFLFAEVFRAFKIYIGELAELYRRIMAQLVASIAVSGRMPCNARCVGYTKMMSTNASHAFKTNTKYMGMRSDGNVHRVLIRDSSVPLTCRAVCVFVSMHASY